MASATKLSFQFAGAFVQHEDTSPVFLRHAGVQGALRILSPPGTEVDKIKIVLKGLHFPTYFVFSELML
jgi:hypothetical protein